MSERETEGLRDQAKPWPKASDLNDAFRQAVAFIDEAISAIATCYQPTARPWGWDDKICTGCSASLSIEEIAARGKVSCCPDRRMVTVRELVDAYEARTTTKAPLSPPPPPPSRG